jgi:hypothetical protein
VYNNGPGAAAGAGGVGGPASTGLAADVLWLFLAGFALIALGLALWPLALRKQD